MISVTNASHGQSGGSNRAGNPWILDAPPNRKSSHMVRIGQCSAFGVSTCSIDELNITDTEQFYEPQYSEMPRVRWAQFRTVRSLRAVTDLECLQAGVVDFLLSVYFQPATSKAYSTSFDRLGCAEYLPVNGNRHLLHHLAVQNDTHLASGPVHAPNLGIDWRLSFQYGQRP